MSVSWNAAFSGEGVLSVASIRSSVCLFVTTLFLSDLFFADWFFASTGIRDRSSHWIEMQGYIGQDQGLGLGLGLSEAYGVVWPRL